MSRKWMTSLFRSMTGLLMAVLFSAQFVPAQAQDDQPIPAPQLSVIRSEPAQMQAGQTVSLTVTGTNFTANTLVAIQNFGLIASTFQSPATMLAQVPPNIPAGVYNVEVRDPAGGAAVLPNALTVIAPPQVSVTGVEPTQMQSDAGGTLSVFGANFTSSTTVRLVGYGLLQTTLIHSGALTASVPAGIPAGQYTIEVADPANGSATAPASLNITQPPQPLPTFEPPTPMPTPQPPTPQPGQPALAARGFNANPAVVAPGGVVRLTFELVNQGNWPAQGVVVSVAGDSHFAPANGQASATVPDIPPGGAQVVTLDVVAAADAPAGPNPVPLNLSYRDFQGETYTQTTTLSVQVSEGAAASQVVMSNYEVNPSPVQPGEEVRIRVLISNTGDKTARRVQLRVSGTDGILLAGPYGDTYPIGDLAPGASSSFEIPMLVRGDAEAGPQSQPFTFTYLQDGESRESAGSMTILVERVIRPEPLLILSEYSYGAEYLQPGDRFTLQMTLTNVGTAAAENTLLQFGEVEAPTDGGNGGQGGTGGSGSGSGGSGNAFAALGVGSSVFAGTIGAGETIMLEQLFIVNGTVSSGIYNLPVNLRYTYVDAEEPEEASLNASLVVISPPRVRMELAEPLPEPANVGEPLPIVLAVENTGTNDVRFDRAEVTAENAEVLEGAQSRLSRLEADDDLTVTALITPNAEGEFSVTFRLHYRDELNQPQFLEHTIRGTAVMPPPPPVEEPPPPVAEPVDQTGDDDFIGRLLLGFLGLGG